jgi:hypothetical protein
MLMNWTFPTLFVLSPPLLLIEAFLEVTGKLERGVATEKMSLWWSEMDRPVLAVC